MKSLFLILLCLMLLFSCGTQSSGKKEKTYSRDVETTFEEIERQKALEKYRQMRWENWSKLSKKKKIQFEKKRIENNFKYQPRNQVIDPPKVTISPEPVPPKKPGLSPEQEEELKVEIDQNMNYFCMKNRKDPRYSKVEKCNKFTQIILNDCTDENDNELGREVLRCVKRKLNLR